MRMWEVAGGICIVTAPQLSPQVVISLLHLALWVDIILILLVNGVHLAVHARASQTS